MTVNHAPNCTGVKSAGFECQSCRRHLCWGCEVELPLEREIKTAVRWCFRLECRHAKCVDTGMCTYCGKRTAVSYAGWCSDCVSEDDL